MIKVSINKSDKVVNNIIINGHANFDEYGKDIVCASVSSIVITSINAILRIDEKAINYQEKEGLVIIDINKHTKVVDLLIENMIDLLEQLQKEYRKNIKIN
ncbi:MAG: ribosomal-processing cysteine protease Prp [Bacilli bacterium]